MVRSRLSHPQQRSRRLGRWVCSTIAAGALLAASFEGHAATKPVEIVHLQYYWHGEAWTEFIHWAAREFERQNPGIRINVMTTGGPGQGAYTSKLTTMIAGGAPPDITEMTPSSAVSYVSEGLMLDLRPYLAQESGGLDLFSPIAARAVTWTDGSVWGVPIDIYPIVTYFNADLFADAGLANPVELGDQWNWDAMVKAGQRITADVNGDGEIDQYGLDRVWAQWSLLAQQAGGRLYDRFVNPTKSLFNTPGVIRGLQMVQDFYNKWKIAVPSFGTHPTFTFWNGNVGMSLVDGPGHMFRLKDVRFAWDVARQPRGPANAGTSVAIDALQILKDTKHPKEAWAWVKFLTMRPETVSEFVKRTGRVPALRAIQSRYRSLVPYAPENVIAFFQAAADPASAPQYVIPKRAEVDAVTAPWIDKVLRGQESPENAAAAIDAQVARILSGK